MRLLLILRVSCSGMLGRWLSVGIGRRWRRLLTGLLVGLLRLRGPLVPDPPKPSGVVRDRAQIDRLYAITDDDLEELKEWIGSVGWPKALVKAFMRHLDADLVVQAWTDDGRSAKVRYPNYAGFAAIAKLVSEYKLRKMADVHELHVTGRVVHELESLSSLELEQIAEGEWTPKLLPPAV